MSTASAPLRNSAERRSPTTSRSLEAIGPMCTLRPPRRSTPARIVGSSQAAVPAGPRNSLASTMSPGSSSRVERAAESRDQDRAVRRSPLAAAPNGLRGAAPSRRGGHPPKARRRAPHAPRAPAARARRSHRTPPRAPSHRNAQRMRLQCSSDLGHPVHQTSMAAGPRPGETRDRRQGLTRSSVAAAHRALHRRGPAGVGPSAGEHQPGHVRLRPRAARTGHPARRGTWPRARASRRTLEPRHHAAAGSSAAERGQVAVPGAPPRSRAARRLRPTARPPGTARRPDPSRRCDRRPIAPASQRSRRTDARARGGRRRHAG